MKFLLWSLLFIFSAVYFADGLKVLGIVPFISKSHFAIGHAIVKSLHDAGHEVTILSPFPLKKPIANYTDIGTPDIIEQFNKGEVEQKTCNRLLTSFSLRSEVQRFWMGYECRTRSCHDVLDGLNPVQNVYGTSKDEETSGIKRKVWRVCVRSFCCRRFHGKILNYWPWKLASKL